MADRNVWDPITPPGNIDLIQSGMVVELYIYLFEKSAKDEKQAKKDVEDATKIWRQAKINIQAVHLHRLPPLFSEPLDLNSSDLAGLFSCALFRDDVRNELFNIVRPGNPDTTRSVVVYYVPGFRFQDGAKGCHQFRWHIDAQPEHFIVLTDEADGRVLAHELGHALFTRKIPSNEWINHDPDPQRDGSQIHNKDPRNLMFPQVADNPIITPVQVSQAQQCALTHHDQVLAFGFKENKPIQLGVIFKKLHVKSTSDEWTSDDALESSWTFKASIKDANAKIMDEQSQTWAMDPLHWYEYPLNLDCSPLKVTSDDGKLVIEVTGIDKDNWPNPDDELAPITKEWTESESWGSDSSDPEIPDGQMGDHMENAKNDEIDYSLTYNVRVVDNPAKVVFRELC